MTSPDLITILLNNLWAVFLAVLFFGGSIFVHELGHFLAARRRGVKVERFSIGFGPKIFSWRGKDGVEYRLAWIPLGGYVLLPQLADMPSIEGEAETPAESLPPVSYSTKVIVFAAGAFFNILFALLLATILWFIGQPTSEEQATTRIGYVAATITLPDKTVVPSPAAQAGLKIGDTIRAIDGEPVRDWSELLQALIISSGRTSDGRRTVVITIERGGEIIHLTTHPVLAGDDEKRKVGIQAAYTPIVVATAKDSLGEKIGLRADDRLVGLNDQPLLNLTPLYEMLRDKSQAFTLTVERAGQNVTLQVPGERTEDPRIILGTQYRTQFALSRVGPVRQVADNVKNTFRVFSSLLNPRSDIGIADMSGPVGIMRIFWILALSDFPFRLILWFTIVINVNLAIFNLLPIPVLDGGHIAFATIAKLRGRPLPFNFIAATQSVFVVLLFSMILYVTVFGDIRRWMRDAKADAQQEEAVQEKKEDAAQPAPATP